MAMENLPPLATMGRRIVILGPSNAGKSTLAEAISRALGIPAIHLDQFRHLPNTDWAVRPDAEFHVLHDAAITEDEWVMDGNYSRLLPQRLARATGVIVMDDHHLPRFGRYLRRTVFEPQRAGGLAGNRDSIKWQMVSWIWKTRSSAGRYRGFARETALPMVDCRSMAQVRALYRHWGLTRLSASAGQGG
jgi:adenylate kinase family enzyme